jgi:hypothetical protein
LDELDEKSNHSKISKLEILKERATRQRILFLDQLIKKIMFKWVQNV